jgi:diguanylate cyclase
MKPSHSADGAFKPIHIAKKKTETVKEDLIVAGAELHLANTALDRSLPAAQKSGDVRKALDQNETVEEKVNKAADELDQVNELLAEEVEERHRLERQLRQAGI